MTPEYEKYLDDETARFMENITYAQIVEALNHYKDTDSSGDALAANLRNDSEQGVFTYLTKICYKYWRKIKEEERRCDIKNSESPFGEEYGPRT